MHEDVNAGYTACLPAAPTRTSIALLRQAQQQRSEAGQLWRGVCCLGAAANPPSQGCHLQEGFVWAPLV